MTFSASSIYIIFLLMGQIVTTPMGKKLPELRTASQVHGALRLSCKGLNDMGPLPVGKGAELNLSDLINVQRQILQNTKGQKQKFIENNCSQQKTSFDQKLQEYLSQNPAVKQQVDSGKNVVLPQFQCDYAVAEKAYSDKATAGSAIPTVGGKLDVLFKEFTLENTIAFWDAFCIPGSKAPIPSFVDYKDVAKQYNTVLREAYNTDLSKFKNFRTSRGAPLLDDRGQPMGDFMDRGKVVHWVESNQIPQVLKDSFVAAEDKNFYTHNGIEPRGILRGFAKMASGGSVEGGSTITQQLIKNLVTGAEFSLNRKAKEMVLARRLEETLKDKDKIITIYLNIINLGRGARGISTAMKRYFGNKARVENIDLNKASFFAGITHSPARYNPSIYPEDKLRTRQKYVLGQLKRAGKISETDAAVVSATPFDFKALRFPRTSYFQSAASKEYLKTTAQESAAPQQIPTTMNTELQKRLDFLSQKRLAEFEMKRNKVIWRGPLRNISYLWSKKDGVTSKTLIDDRSIWKNEMVKSQSLYQGVYWKTAVVLQTSGKHLIGLVDGKGEPQVAYLKFNDMGTNWYGKIVGKLKIGDVIFVESKAKEGFFFRVPPTVQSGTVVMNVQTGEVRAISGGFDYSTAPLNRAVNSFRQVGSTAKPFSFLAAFDMGYTPEQMYYAGPTTFPPIGRGGHSWTPKNYSEGRPLEMPIRNGLMESNNRLTANLMTGIAGPNGHPVDALHFIYNTMVDFGLYGLKPNETIYYPTVLGSKESTVLRLAMAYGAIANGGWVVAPTFLKRAEGTRAPAHPVQFVDRESIIELSKVLRDAVNEGTGRNAKRHAYRIAGKTGTTTGHQDVWFASYSNQHVVVTWMGYDEKSVTLSDGRKIPVSMGTSATGGGLGAPYVAEIYDTLFELKDNDGKNIDEGYKVVDLLADYNYHNGFRDYSQVGGGYSAGHKFTKLEGQVDSAISTEVLPPVIEEQNLVDDNFSGTQDLFAPANTTDRFTGDIGSTQKRDSWGRMQQTRKQMLKRFE